MLEFKSLGFEYKNTINKYYNKFGERSCQHSFATSFCLKNKYNDLFAHCDDTLYIVRDGISDSTYRTYLFPMCDRNNLKRVETAVNNILIDSHSYNKKVRFLTITEQCKLCIEELFQDLFVIESCRDLYEYIYDTEKIAKLSGSMYQSKRNIINKLYKTYKDIIVKQIDNTDFNAIKLFYKKWQDYYGRADGISLNNEIKEFDIAINNYYELELVGIAIYINNELAGFNFGSIISSDTYDGMIQKGNLQFEGIYELLNRETAKLFLSRAKYMNFEEDLGVIGLRNSKQMYHPEYLLKKFIAKEI